MACGCKNQTKSQVVLISTEMSVFFPAMPYSLLFACYPKARFLHTYRNKSNIKANSNSNYRCEELSPFTDT